MKKLHPTGAVSLILLLMPSILFLVVLTLSYKFDDELHPEALEVINSTPGQIDIANNGYYALLGMFVSEGEEPHSAGIEIVEKVKAKSTETDFEPFVLITDISGAVAIEPTIDGSTICDFNEGKGCLGKVKKKYKYYTGVVSDNQILINRLRSLYRYTAYQESQYDISITNVINTHKLLLLDLMLLWDREEYQETINYLAEDLKYWRKISKSEVSLIMRMISLALIRHDLNILSELVSDCAKCIKIEDVENRLLPPFTQEELDLKKVFDDEFRYLNSSILRVIEQEGMSSFSEDASLNLFWKRYIFKSLYKRNRVLNKMYDQHSRITNLSQCKIDKYLDCFEEYRNSLKTGIDYFSIEFIRDPIGEIIIGIDTPDYHKYVWISYRMELIRRLIYTKYILHNKDVPHGEINLYLLGIAENLQNPFLGYQVEYDEETFVLNMPVPIILDKPVTIYY